jgi:hypothetical protein
MGGGGTSSTTTQQLSPEQQRILGLVTPVFESYFPASAPGTVAATTYPNQTLAGTDPFETLGQQLTLGATPGVAGVGRSAAQGTNFLASGDVLDVMRNPGLQGAINAATRPITESFGQTILPNIRDEAVLAGGYGDNRQGISEGMASQAYLRQIGDTASGLVNQAYQGGLDAMTRGIALAPGTQQGLLAPGAAVAGVGAQERAFEQAAIDDSVRRFYEEQFLPLMLAQQVAGTALGFPGGTTVTTSEGGGTSAAQGVMGGASMLMALLPLMFMSDEEMKEDIEPLDAKSVVEGLEKLELFTWKYKDDETPHMGPMAQDFQEAFGVGDGKTIHLADVSAVMLAVGKQMVELMDEVKGESE